MRVVGIQVVLRYETKVGKACEKSDMISDFQLVPFALKAASNAQMKTRIVNISIAYWYRGNRDLGSPGSHLEDTEV